MIKLKDISNSENTLGYYRLGTPCLFVRSDVFFQNENGPTEIRISEENVKNKKLSLSDFRSWTSRATPIHELRHFHDSLLTPFLFDYQLIISQRSVLSLLICFDFKMNNLNSLNFKTFEQNWSKLSENTRNLYSLHINSLNKYYKEYGNCFEKNKIGLDYTFLLEFNSKLTEVVLMRHLINDDNAIEYINSWIHSLPVQYTELFNFLKYIGGDNKFKYESLIIMYSIVTYSLYSGLNPIKRFEFLMKEFRNNLKLLEKAEKGVYLEQIKSYHEKRQFEIVTFPKELSQQHIVPMDFLEFRREYYTKYISKYGINLGHYFNCHEKLTLPPIVFSPLNSQIEDEKIPAMYRSNYEEYFGKVFSISTREGKPNDHLITSGICPMLPKVKSIDLGKISNSINFQYATQFIFNSEYDVATEIMEQVVDTIKELFNLEIKN